MRALVLIHRWLGVVFCLLFAMWFASGMVMHFVPFPSLSEAERVAGLPVLALPSKRVDIMQVFDFKEKNLLARMHLSAPAGVPVYIGRRLDGTITAFDGASGAMLVVDTTHALASARAHAQARGLDAAHAAHTALASHDQWSVPNGFDAHRPLHRIALNDAAHTEIYVSSVTGEVVLDTTRFERAWNWAGSVVHWLYPTVLRQHWATWDRTVWWLSLMAMMGALAGAALGVIRLNGLRSPYRGWMFWHHTLGLTCALFVLTWIFSGWLSMDHGRIFSNGQPTDDERARIIGVAPSDVGDIKAPFKEIEWFGFAGQTMTRVIDASGKRRLHAGTQSGPWLSSAQLDSAARALGATCMHAVVAADDAYPAQSIAGGVPVYRITCGDTWFHIDGADGRIIEKLDASRRAYRWAYQALHTLDFPLLAQRETLRTLLILALCSAGLAFSLTGAVIGWRRLKRTVL